MDKRFDDVDQRFDGIDQRFDGIDQRFDGVDQQFIGINQRFQWIDQKFVKIDRELAGIKQRLDQQDKNHQESMVVIAGLIDGVNDHIDKKLSTLGQGLQNFNERFNRLAEYSGHAELSQSLFI